MLNDKKSILLPSQRFADAPASDTYLSLNIEQQHRERKQLDFFKTIEGYEAYERERNLSDCYRFAISVQLFFSNMLINKTGEDGEEGWTAESEGDAQLRASLLYENNGWYGYRKKADYCEVVEFTPKKTDIAISDTNEWEYGLYQVESEDNQLEFNGIKLENGLAIWQMEAIEVLKKNMVKIHSAVHHNLLRNDFIYLTTGTNTIICKVFDVIDTFTFLVNNPSLPLTTIAFFSKLEGQTKVEYYARKLKLIKNPETVFKNSFADSYYHDNTAMVIEDGLDITDLLDHKAKPLKAVYLGVSKKNGLIWGNLISGWGLDGQTAHNVEHINENLSYQYYSYSDLYLDICEYNPVTKKETSISAIEYLFNTQDRQDNGYPESYVHVPFKELTIRDYNALSGDYSRTLRPLINGCHYVEDRMDLYVCRQDPCQNTINDRQFISTCPDTETSISMTNFHDC